MANGDDIMESGIGGIGGVGGGFVAGPYTAEELLSLGWAIGSATGSDDSIVDVSDATITSATVVLGEVGYGNDGAGGVMRVVGEYDSVAALSAAYEDGKGEGRAEFIASMADATVEPMVLHTGFVAYGHDGERIEGSYNSSDTYDQGLADGKQWAVDLVSDATAGAGDIVVGKAAYGVGLSKVAGTLDVAALEGVAYNNGVVDGTVAGRLEVISEQSDGDITAADVMKGKIGYASGNTRVVGTHVDIDVVDKPVKFYDFDGVEVASYTLDEAHALTALPALSVLPAHDLLTPQGWTHSLDEVHAATDILHVGAMYHTVDGATYVFFELTPVTGVRVQVNFLKVNPGAATSLHYDIYREGDVGGTAVASGDLGTSGQAFELGAGMYGKYVARIIGDGNWGPGGSNSIMYFFKTTTTNSGRLVSSCYLGTDVVSVDYAFYECASLTSIMIPDSVTSFGGNSSFPISRCYSLRYIALHNGISSIPSSSFNGCYSLRYVVLPNGISSIPASSFNGCYSLESITIPASVMSIGNSTFSSCYSLTNIVVPASVVSVGNSCFSNAYCCLDYVFEATVPPSLGSSAFYGILDTAKIYVPDASVDAYKTATNWSAYANYIHPISERVV